jgi:hypothetical protein
VRVDIACARCQHSYFVPDDLVHGRTFRAKCTQCGHEFSAEGAPESADPKPAAPAEETAAPAGQAPRRPRRIAAIAAAVALAGAAGGIALWIGTRSGGEARARTKVVAAAESVAAPVEEVGGVAAGVPRQPLAVQPYAPPAAPAEPAAPPAAPPQGAAALPEQPPTPPAVASAPTPTPAPGEPTPVATPPPLAAASGELPSSAEAQAPVPAPDRTKKTGAPARPPKTKRAAAAAERPPSPAEKAIAKNRAAFDACVSKALAADPAMQLARRATLVVTVQPDGTVSQASVVGALGESAAGSCLAAAARGMTFPPFEGEAREMAMPLSLAPAR